MRLLLPACLLLGLVTSAASCRKNDEPEPTPTICPIETCPGAGNVVKTVTDTRGIVRLNPVTKEYAIATLPSVTNSFDVGVLCTALPTNLQVDGTKVLFSGTYRLKPGGSTAGDVATYYLTTSAVSLDPNP
ncbi:MAG: hypothetical protein ACRYF0_17605 [Janthinobacterium lividum]